jgi:hypothetical protein
MAEFRGTPLLYNAAAHFAAQERFPTVEADDEVDGKPVKRGEGGLLYTIGQSNAQGLTALCWALETMSGQACAARKLLGIRAPEPLDAARLMLDMRPSELTPARMAVMEAMTRGLRAPKDDKDEVDEVLEELGKNAQGR